MKKIIAATFFMFIFLAWQSKVPTEVKKVDCPPDRDGLVRDLEFKKAEEIYLFCRARCEQLRSVHPHQNKDLMEAELKLKLSKIDLEIARLMLD